jgi:hypothetical protein
MLMLTAFRQFLHRFASQIWNINYVGLIQVHRKSDIGVLGEKNESSLEINTEGLNLVRNYIRASIFHTIKS